MLTSSNCGHAHQHLTGKAPQCGSTAGADGASDNSNSLNAEERESAIADWQLT